LAPPHLESHDSWTIVPEPPPGTPSFPAADALPELRPVPRLRAHAAHAAPAPDLGRPGADPHGSHLDRSHNGYDRTQIHQRRVVDHMRLTHTQVLGIVALCILAFVLGVIEDRSSQQADIHAAQSATLNAQHDGTVTRDLLGLMEQTLEATQDSLALCRDGDHIVYPGDTAHKAI
jgi:hypothetical protein